MSLAPLWLLLLAQAASLGDSVRPKAPPGLSWADADGIATQVATIERRLKAGKPASREPITASERQVNSYVNLTLAAKIPPAISGLNLRFEPGKVLATGMLDLDAVRSKMPPSGPGTLLTFLSGVVPVSLKGRFVGANGEGKVQVEEALVSGISLPAALVSQIVAQATRSSKNPQGFDLLTPFPLPWTARNFRLEAGRVVVDFKQEPVR